MIGKELRFVGCSLLISIGLSSPGLSVESSSTAAKLTDGQVIGILYAANQGEVDLGNLARSKAKGKDVIEFATQMVNEHGSVLIETNNLSLKNNARPENSPSKVGLETAGTETKEKLSKLKGAEFDKAYIDTQVAMHQSVLTSIDKELLPNARSVELKALVEKIRPAVEHHLDRAKKIQGKL